MDIRDLLSKDRFLFLDGAMGTMLQERGLQAGEIPELWNLTKPDKLAEIYAEYLQSGAQILTTNTFGANARKLPDRDTVIKVITAGVEIAREAITSFTVVAKDRFVALDIGPTGALLEPLGTMKFEEAYDLFTEMVQAGADAGADLVLIETMTDLMEAKAAVLAAKEHSSLPVFVSMTFEEDGRTFVGTSPDITAVTLTGLGVDALGINCSLGPQQLLPMVQQMAAYTNLPVMVQANAGLPRVENGKTVYDITPEAYTTHVKKLANAGASILGGCCGTTPEYIRQMTDAFQGEKPASRLNTSRTCVTSGQVMVDLTNRTAVIGERINPTGKKKLKMALREEKYGYLMDEASNQQDCGADILDVNVGLPELDEKTVLTHVVKELQGITSLPLQIDSSDPEAVEQAVRHYNGKPIINSVNGTQESMDAILPIVKKYGTAVVALTMDEHGIPKTAKERVSVAGKIIMEAEKYGIPVHDIFVDCLVLTASTNQEMVMETIRAVGLVKETYGVKTVLGVSNVSFGLPNREQLNSVFLAAALGAGLDLPILNPMSDSYMNVMRTFRVLHNEDQDASLFIQHFQEVENVPINMSGSSDPKTEWDIRQLILSGRKNHSAEATRLLLKEKTVMEIINEDFIPALDEVGQLFEKGTLFLPQLMASAETVKQGFDVLKDVQSEAAIESKGTVLLATVKGDVHDIGKNIVKMLLENYGYTIVDMGRDVEPDAIVQKVLEKKIHFVGLSALMTTTVPNMQVTISKLREAGCACIVIVGGAVLNPEYAKMVGADYYAKDAATTAKIIGSL